MGAREQAVHRGAGEQRVAEEGGELVRGAVRGEDSRAVLVGLADDLVEEVAQCLRPMDQESRPCLTQTQFLRA